MEQRKCENTDGTKQNKRRQEYTNEYRLKIHFILSSISNGALVCLTCVASNSTVKRWR
ncbi:conserved hypothetical protein [Trichinella spiralis]|uniref:hypothetical protein n=1 Tax=Trichinella spiralis TaxID=6334 RepID=UPI0001EFD53B|nr:conserved hypothetical protein [Trichinella spiralis]